MKRAIRSIFLVPFLCSTQWGHAKEVGPPDKLHLYVELTDGSSLYGTTSLTKVGVRTTYLEGEFPLSEVRKIEREGNGGPLVFSMSNGDQLRGTLLQGGFPLKSLLGDLAIPGKHVRRIGVLPDGTSSIPRVGLVAYYPADGNAQDASGNGYHGVNKGCTWTADRHGKPKGAFLFDGRRGFIHVGDRAELDSDEAFTVSAWIRPGAYRTRSHGSAGIARKWFSSPWGGQPGHGDYMLILGTDGRVALHVCNSDQGYVSDSLTSESAVPKNAWSHVAGTFDRGTMRIYVNGQLKGEKTSTKVKFTTRKEYGHDDVTIGGLWDHAGTFHGAIDEVRIYNRALHRGEIKRLATTNLTSRAGERPERELSRQWLLGAGFAVPMEAKDKHANPVRQGNDEKTGLPLEIRHQETGMHLVFIPDGAFLMGATGNGGQYTSRERPQHVVRITEPFYMGKYEVTTGEFARFAEDANYTTEAERRGQGHLRIGERWVWTAGANWKNPNFPQTAAHPVVLVSWNDAQEFVKWLSEGVRSSPPQGARGEARGKPAEADYYKLALPTEAQWEYTCRAGTETPQYFDPDPSPEEFDRHVWSVLNSGERTNPVGKKRPNAWGLYDMLGNATEWTANWYGQYPPGAQTDPTGPPRGADRVVRGGNWLCKNELLRATLRGIEKPRYCGSHLGFRVALAVPELDGLALWLKADAGVVRDAEGGVSKWEDLSGHANHARQSSSSKRPRRAREADNARPALAFDGTDDQLDVPHSDTLNLTREFTAAAWVKLARADTCTHPVIMGKYTWVGGQRNWDFLYTQKGDLIVLRLWPAGAGRAEQAEAVTSETRVKPDRWYHVAAVFSPGRVALYLDGVLESERAIPEFSLKSFPSVPVQIGWVNCGSGREYLKGAIDDIRIYSRALTGLEIAVLVKARPKE